MTVRCLKLGPYDIEINKLNRTVILCFDGKELDLTTEQAEELYEELGNVLGAVPTYLDEWTYPTH